MSKFYGIEAAPGKETKFVFSAPSEVFHLSVIAIPAGAQGSATLYATVDGSTFAVATLDSARKIFQVAVDLIFPASQKPVLTVKGNTKLHVTGYIDDMNEGMPGDDEDFSDDGASMDEEDDDEEDEDEEEDDLPVEKATKALEAKKAEAPAAKKAEAAPAKAESEDDEEDEDEEDMDDEELAALLAEEDEEMDEEDGLDFAEEDEESDLEEDSEDEEVAAPPAAKGRTESGKPQQGKPQQQQGKPQQQQGKPQQGKPQQVARQTGQKYGRV